MSRTVEQDVKDILDVHYAWIYSNDGLDIKKMYPNFANPGYYQFNMNGMTYESVDEKVKLWEGFHKVGFDLRDFSVVAEPRVTVDHDMAYLTAIWKCRYSANQGKGSALMKADYDEVEFRVTEVYRRDDGKGNSVWKIWHFHASPSAPAGSAKYPQDEA